MAKNGILTQYDDAGYPAAAAFAVPLTFAGGAVKGSAGRLLKVIVTTAFAGVSGVLTFYDNASAASGTPLLAIPTGTAVGTIYTIDVPAANGIFAGNSALTAGAITVGYS